MMNRMGKIALATALALVLSVKSAVTAQAQTPVPAPDPVLAQAEGLVGKALFVRGFYAANDLAYNAQGDLQNAAKVKEKLQDWTLSAVNVLKAQRRGRNEIQLDGVRAAIRYNPDSHQFERHPHNDEAVRITIATLESASASPTEPSESQQFERALAVIFAIGIDPALQRSMPEFWRHYFDPALPWGKDALADVRIISPGSPPPGSPEAQQMVTFVNPVAVHRENAKFTDLAVRDKVNGEIELRTVVDAEGIPRRITIVHPIGYGLDARAVEAVANWRFRPGTLEGKPVATNILIRELFDVPTPQHP